MTDPTGLCGGSWNPLKYADCPRKFIQKHPKVQRDIVLTADVVAIGFTGLARSSLTVPLSPVAPSDRKGALVGTLWGGLPQLISASWVMLPAMSRPS